MTLALTLSASAAYAFAFGVPTSPLNLKKDGVLLGQAHGTINGYGYNNIRMRAALRDASNPASNDRPVYMKVTASKSTPRGLEYVAGETGRYQGSTFSSVYEINLYAKSSYSGYTAWALLGEDRPFAIDPKIEVSGRL